MRVLASVTGSTSHTRALSIALWPLVNAGHQVRVVAAAGVAHGLDELAAAGVHVIPTLPDPLAMLRDPVLAARLVASTSASDHTGTEAMIAPAVEGLFVLDAARVLLAEAADFRPDLILRDDSELGAALAARQLGIPVVALCGALSNLLDPGRWVDSLNRHWHGLGHDDDLDEQVFYPFGRIDYVPEAFGFAGHDTGPVHRFQQPLWTRPGDRLPPWVTELDDNKPLVYLSLGTAVAVVAGETAIKLTSDPRATLTAAVTALSDMDCVALVATGGMELAGPLPRHIHVSPSVPQPLVLEAADVFVTHAGYNSVREAVRSATPMLAIPCFGDQPHLAGRIEQLGLGRQAVSPTPDEVRGHLEFLVKDESCARRARSARTHLLALPPADELPGLLRDLAGIR